MDGDVFAKAGRWGRQAAHALFESLSGRPDTAQAIPRFFEMFLAKAGGIRLLPYVFAQLDRARSVPLLAHGELGALARNIELRAREAGSSDVDLLVARETARAARRGDTNSETLVERLLGRIADRTIFESRGGFIDQYGHTRLNEAKAALAGTLAKAAGELVRRPEAKRLSLTLRTSIGADTNLL